MSLLMFAVVGLGPLSSAAAGMLTRFGVTWLFLSVDAFTTMSEALAAGFTPFVLGDAVKIVAAGLLLPLAWKLLDRYRQL